MEQMMKKVLHICSAFSKNRFYSELFSSLSESGTDQIVYSAVRTPSEANRVYDGIQDLECHIHNILRPYHRLLYRTKIRKISRDLLKSIHLDSVGVIHAHTLYSDGGAALSFFKNHGIPYITAVRSTDVNYFMRLRPDLSFRRDQILLCAERIILLSPVLAEKLEQHLSRNVWNGIHRKIEIIPNGIPSFWFDTPSLIRNQEPGECLKLLFIGNFDRPKNVRRLIRAVESLRKKRKVTLTLVGRGGSDYRQILNMVKEDRSQTLNFLGRIDDREQLKNIYREHDLLTMPSYYETFGLVYIEALSQGLPILCGSGEGVDGFFNENRACETANPFSVRDIEEKIELLALRMEHSRDEAVKVSRAFNWPRISALYKELYQNYL